MNTEPSTNSQDYSKSEETQSLVTEPGTSSITASIEQVNIADDLDEELLDKIGTEVYDGYKADLDSRKHWEINLDDWTKLALQVREDKSYPWPKASNIKYPLLSTAAMQFSARAYPTLIPADGNIVHTEVVGEDPTGQKEERARRISKFMSYQLMKEMDDWDESMDKLLIILPIVGTCFKKTYWDSIEQKNCSKLIMPKDLVVNYWAKSLDSSERKTERIEMSKRILTERVNAEVFLDVDLGDPKKIDLPLANAHGTVAPSKDDRTTPYVILEQHTFWDLDEDGYDEPYIITIEEQSRKVLRIVARFDADGVTQDDDGKLIKIEPVEYYTKYGFIPNPDGGFYDIGFGLLLGPINASVNTIVNQLVDSGTLYVLQAGFIGKGLRIKAGDSSFKPGEWKYVNATGDDIKKQIYPLPVREPSKVLFELLGMLVQASKELASVAEIFVGKMPGQNTPATTTMATIEQGMKVFTAIYKRVYRSLTKELKKLYRLNRIYLDPKIEVNILDAPIGQQDFEDKSYDVCPAADPSATSSQEKLAKAEMLMQLLPLGTLNPMAVTQRILMAQEQTRPEELINQGPPPVDPKIQIEQQKAQISQQESAQKMQIEQMKAELDARAKQMEMVMKAQMQQQELQFKQAMAMLEIKSSQIEHSMGLKQQAQQHQMDMETSKQSHAMDLKQQEEKMQQQKEAAKLKQTQAKKESKPKK